MIAAYSQPEATSIYHLVQDNISRDINDDRCTPSYNNSSYFKPQTPIFEIQNRLFIFTQSGLIRKEVYANTSRIIYELPEFAILKIENDDFYASNNGTVLFEFEDKNTDSIFSLEIGRESLGYYAELNGKTIDYADLLRTDTDNIDNTICKLNSSLLEYFEKTGQIS